MTYVWDSGLSDKEILFIGMFSVQWACLEHEIFTQTLNTFASEGNVTHNLPKEMNNIQFTGVLDLWKERVAEKAKSKQRKILLQQYLEILELKNPRDALMHGMWHWSPENLGRISTVRVKKRDVITTHFSADELEDFAKRVGEINFKIRFPRGAVDLAIATMQQGGYTSRRSMAIFSGANLDHVTYSTGYAPEDITTP